MSGLKYKLKKELGIMKIDNEHVLNIKERSAKFSIRYATFCFTSNRK